MITHCEKRLLIIICLVVTPLSVFEVRGTIQWMRNRNLDPIIPYLRNLCDAPRNDARYDAAYKLNKNTQYARMFGRKKRFYVQNFESSLYDDYERGKNKVVEIMISIRDGTIPPATVAYIQAVAAAIEAPAALGN